MEVSGARAGIVGDDDTDETMATPHTCGAGDITRDEFTGGCHL